MNLYLNLWSYKMNWIITVYPTLVTTIGVIDAIFILIMGLISAILILFDIKADKYWERVWPASLTLVGTSVASGIVFTITRYVAVWASHV